MAKGIKQLYGYPLIDQTARNDIKNNYQKKTDENLQTTDKTIVGSINEVVAQCKDIAKQTITTEERNKLTSLNNYDDSSIKTNIQNVQQQVNNLVLGAVGDGNNAEVVQARGEYDTLNDRSNAIEKRIDNFSIEGLGEEMTCFFENNSPNLINPNTKIYNNSQLHDGDILTNETWTSKVTDFVKLRSTKTIRTTTSLILKVALYDNSKTYISTADLDSSTPINLDSINNASYIRLMIYSDLSTFMVYQSDTVIPIIEPYGDFSLKKAYLEEPVENIVKDKIYPIKPTDTNFVEYDITNYGLFVDIYENKKYDSTGYLVEDSSGNYNATSITKLDKNKNMYMGVKYLSYAVFFDANKNYISAIDIYYGKNIEKTNYPTNAEYVAFYYYKTNNGLIADKFYVSTIDNSFNLKAYSTIKKIKNTRPIINIYTTDSEEQIFLKFCNAWYTGDCDVYFEYGIYNFNTIFELIKTKYSWNTAYELPIGSNCRYYFNNSTLIGTSTSSDNNVTNNTSILGSHRLSGSYELYDGNLIANNIVYAVHDEASAHQEPYIRKYHNMNMEYHKGNNTQYLSKCIGVVLVFMVSVLLINVLSLPTIMHRI